MQGKWNEMSEAKWERGRRPGRGCVCNFGKKCCHTYRHRYTHIHIERHTYSHTYRDTDTYTDIPWSYAVILCSLELYAILARRFMVLPTPSLHLTTSSPPPLPCIQSKKHSTQTKALFPFSSGFSLPAFLLSFFFLGKLFMEFILLRCLPHPALPCYLSSSLFLALCVRLSQSVLAVPFL